MADQSSKDTINTDTNVRQVSAREGAVNINMGTLVGSYETVARMLDEMPQVPNTGVVLLTFDNAPSSSIFSHVQVRGNLDPSLRSFLQRSVPIIAFARYGAGGQESQTMRQPSFIPKIDPFLLCLIAVVAAASLLPVRGPAAAAFDVIADLAIMLLFFLHGAKLSREAIVQGIGNWRLHALVLASTFVWFPLVGYATGRLASGWLDPLLVSGVLFLTLLPSTVQSSIAFTAMARGNVAAAVCSASLSNLLGIVITPLLASLLIHSPSSGVDGGQGFDWHAARGIVEQLLLPFLAGHFLRPLIGKWVDRHKKILMPVDRGSILLVVYTAFSAAVVNGIWQVLGLEDLLVLLVISALILAAIMGANALIARLAGLSREDAIVLLFCGSKKSLVSGVPMAGALFAPAQVGMVVLPLMIFHQLQLFVCAWLAARYARAAEETPSAPTGDVPQTPEQIAQAARARGITIPAACTEGVAANLSLLSSHAKRLRDAAPPVSA